MTPSPSGVHQTTERSTTRPDSNAGVTKVAMFRLKAERPPVAAPALHSVGDEVVRHAWLHLPGLHHGEDAFNKVHPPFGSCAARQLALDHAAEQPRSAGSAALLVGGSSGLRKNVHSARHTLTMFAHVLAVRLHCVCVLPSSS